jgi:hypothetical protein
MRNETKVQQIANLDIKLRFTRIHTLYLMLWIARLLRRRVSAEERIVLSFELIYQLNSNYACSRISPCRRHGLVLAW